MAVCGRGSYLNVLIPRPNLISLPPPNALLSFLYCISLLRYHASFSHGSSCLTIVFSLALISIEQQCMTDHRRWRGMQGSQHHLLKSIPQWTSKIYKCGKEASPQETLPLHSRLVEPTWKETWGKIFKNVSPPPWLSIGQRAGLHGGKVWSS